MALFLGTSIVILVLFMVAAMALAEWADKDPGDLLAKLWKRKPAASASSQSAVEPAAAGAGRKPKIAAAQSRRAGISSAKQKFRASKAAKAKTPVSAKRKAK